MTHPVSNENIKVKFTEICQKVRSPKIIEQLTSHNSSFDLQRY